MADMVQVDIALGSQPGDPNWNPYADVNGDGDCNADDMFTYLAPNYGKKYP